MDTNPVVTWSLMLSAEGDHGELQGHLIKWHPLKVQETVTLPSQSRIQKIPSYISSMAVILLHYFFLTSAVFLRNAEYMNPVSFFFASQPTASNIAGDYPI